MNNTSLLGDLLVMEQDRAAQLAKGWGLSIALHGCLILAVMTMMPKLTLTQESQPFRWTVDLVDAPAPTPAASASVPPAPQLAPTKPAQAKAQPARPPEPPPQLTMRQVQRQDTPPPIHREAEPVQRNVQTVQQDPQPKVEAERPAQRAEPLREVTAMENTKPDEHEIKRAEPVVDTPAPAIQQQAAETRPEPELVARAPAIEAPEPIIEKPAPVEQAAPNDPIQPAPVSPPTGVAEAIESPPIPPAATTNDEPVPAGEEQAPVVARSVAPQPARKADHRWLAESLHRRIVELRHYPSAARLNGWEGKVVLRVQIRQDGNLDSVSVVQSSGHETLDNAAMEAVRRACPLHLKHELASPMVVVQVPINYSLNR